KGLEESILRLQRQNAVLDVCSIKLVEGLTMVAIQVHHAFDLRQLARCMICALGAVLHSVRNDVRVVCDGDVQVSGHIRNGLHRVRIIYLYLFPHRSTPLSLSSCSLRSSSRRDLPMSRDMPSASVAWVTICTSPRLTLLVRARLI